MIDPHNEAVQQFLKGLAKLTKETGVAIDGCGCCGSPRLEPISGLEKHYVCDEVGHTLGYERDGVEQFGPYVTATEHTVIFHDC